MAIELPVCTSDVKMNITVNTKKAVPKIEKLPPKKLWGLIIEFQSSLMSK